MALSESQIIQDIRDGVYHEIGHVIATKICFPAEDRLDCIRFYKKENGSYGMAEIWKDSIKFNAYTQLDAFTKVSLSGGVFQQMKSLYSDKRDGQLHFSMKEKVIHTYNKSKAYKSFFQRNVNPRDTTMTEDLGLLLAIYDELFEHKKISSRLNIEKEKSDCIDYLLPFIDSSEIDDLCEYCTKLFWEAGQNRLSSVDIPETTIMKYIGTLFC